MSLSLLKSSRAANTVRPGLVLYVRTYATAERPRPAAKQWRPPASEVGYFSYERDFSRDSHFTKPQKLGDTWMRALTRKLHHAYEVYPIFALIGVWFVVFVYTSYISFDKIEVWFNRSNSKPPWDWERARDNYWKRHTLAFDPTGKTHTRLPIMEQLQDEMVAAAKARGTR